MKELQNSSHGMNFTNASVSEWNMFSCTCSQEELGFATFRLSNSSLGSKNSSLGPSALGMNFSPLGWITAFRLQNPILPSCSARNYIILALGIAAFSIVPCWMIHIFLVSFFAVYCLIPSMFKCKELPPPLGLHMIKGLHRVADICH